MSCLYNIGLSTATEGKVTKHTSTTLVPLESFMENHIVNTRFGIIWEFLLNILNPCYSCSTEKAVRKTLSTFLRFRLAVCQLLVLCLEWKQQ